MQRGAGSARGEGVQAGRPRGLTPRTHGAVSAVQSERPTRTRRGELKQRSSTASSLSPEQPERLAWLGLGLGLGLGSGSG
jgi:hypothetical protein